MATGIDMDCDIDMDIDRDSAEMVRRVNCFLALITALESSTF